MTQRNLTVLVCGGRDYQDRAAVMRELDALSEATDEYPLGSVMLTVVTGGCPTGADDFAADWAVVNWCPLHEFKADWNRYGRAAGPIRNRQMLRERRPDLVLAFPGNTGTADMIKAADEAGVKFRKVGGWPQ